MADQARRRNEGIREVDGLDIAVNKIGTIRAATAQVLDIEGLNGAVKGYRLVSPRAGVQDKVTAIPANVCIIASAAEQEVCAATPIEDVGEAVACQKICTGAPSYIFDVDKQIDLTGGPKPTHA